MLDLSSEFNAEDFVKKLCEKQRVRLNYSVNFPRGWAQIVEDFINEVKNYNLVIEKIDIEYSQLEIYVDLSKTSQGKKIYTMLVSSKLESRKTCAGCSSLKSYKESSNIYCRECQLNVSVIKPTGTWLDNY